MTLRIADTPRNVAVPPDFAAALKEHEGARQFFDGLSNSLQRYHVDNINAAKTPETRQRRIDRAVSLFPDRQAEMTQAHDAPRAAIARGRRIG